MRNRLLPAHDRFDRGRRGGSEGETTDFVQVGLLLWGWGGCRVLEVYARRPAAGRGRGGGERETERGEDIAECG